MDEKIKKKFIGNLEKYKKGKDYLKETIDDEDKFTLMGVFCDVFRNTLQADWIENPLIKDRKTYYLLGSCQEISKILIKKLKIKVAKYDIIKECQKKYKNELDFKKEIIYLNQNL